MELFVLKGILAGLGVTLLVGPIFFGLLQLSIERGARAGIIFAMGIWVSDLIYVRMVQLGLGFIGENATFLLSVGIIGSAILMVFGAVIFFGPLRKQMLSSFQISHAAEYFFKGVAINVFNPFVFLLWISILSNIHTESLKMQWIFVASMLSVIALTDILKAIYAAKIGARLTERHLLNIKKAAGVLLGLFGLILLVRTILSVSH